MLFPSNCEAFLPHRRRLTSRLSEKTTAEDAALIAPIFFCVCVCFVYRPHFLPNWLSRCFLSIAGVCLSMNSWEIRKVLEPLGLVPYCGKCAQKQTNAESSPLWCHRGWWQQTQSALHLHLHLNEQEVQQGIGSACKSEHFYWMPQTHG